MAGQTKDVSFAILIRITHPIPVMAAMNTIKPKSRKNMMMFLISVIVYVATRMGGNTMTEVKRV